MSDDDQEVTQVPTGASFVIPMFVFHYMREKSIGFEAYCVRMTGFQVRVEGFCLLVSQGKGEDDGSGRL